MEIHAKNGFLSLSSPLLQFIIVKGGLEVVRLSDFHSQGRTNTPHE